MAHPANSAWKHHHMLSKSCRDVFNLGPGNNDKNHPKLVAEAPRGSDLWTILRF